MKKVISAMALVAAAWFVSTYDVKIEISEATASAGCDFYSGTGCAP